MHIPWKKIYFQIPCLPQSVSSMTVVRQVPASIGPSEPAQLSCVVAGMSPLLALVAFAAPVLASEGFYTPVQPELALQSTRGVEIPREGQRPLSVRVTFPSSGGPYPIIVFSHGMYGSETGMDPLIQTWAKHGYVVIQPTHADSLRYADAEVWRDAMRGSLDNVDNWRERPGDIKLVLDHLEWLEGKVPDLKGKMDRKKIGMSGHSYGAWTTQMVAGMKLISGKQTLTLADPRPKAFVVISPHGLGGGITEDSFGTMRSPMLFVSGDNDHGRGDWDPKVHRRQAFDLCPPGDRTLVWIKDAYHDFGGLTGRSPRRPRSDGLMGAPNPAHVKLAQNSTLAFWDAYLKARPEARRFWSARPFGGVDGVKIELR